ncbi:MULTISPECIES: MFS transporter [Arthrobacter]|uniref:MFS transporter n=2 Tax=Arthrobacter TaxID=1663 RepID=A0ABU9KI64_9MICC|nr:MFS transporter [Arthrobacter sp. YJM1]MDP5226399.1 MFS transporter [Arthrobacter sp. YJM1]
MTAAEPPFRFRSVALAVYLPTILFSTGEGAVLPMIPVMAHTLGASLSLAAAIAAMVVVGELVGDIPAGWFVARFGERNSMIGATGLALAGIGLSLTATAPWPLMVGVLLIGLATSVFALARHAFMTTRVPLRYRARALSALGGVFRAGWFIGPLIAAAVIARTGTPQAAFWIFATGCAAAVVALLVLPDPEARGDARPAAAGHGPGLFRTIHTHRATLLRMGSGVALVGATRAARITLLPLWALSIGLSEAHTALVIGLAGGLEFALFYTSGQLMDRRGRLWSVLPCMLGLGVGFLALAFLHDVPGRDLWFTGVAFLLGVANGMGSGIVMTLGADLAPRDNPAAFLGAWRFSSDAGQAASPLLIAALASLSLPLASGVIGALAFLGAGLLARFIPRYIPHRPRR